MKKFKENNKGFSLVELIVVIAIMVVLVAVLGSTILGYVDKSKYSKDVSALDSINTAVKAFVADPSSKYEDGKTYTLEVLMDSSIDAGGVIKPILAEVFNTTTGDFNNASKSFDDVKLSTVYVSITNGAVAVLVETDSGDSYANYTAGDQSKINKSSAIKKVPTTPTTPTTPTDKK